MSALAVIGALAVGLSLGLTGAGGSILTLPVLVHLAGVPPREAVGLSLLVVGAAALAGAVQRARAGDLHRPALLWFALAGMAGAALGSRFTVLVPPAVLMLLFGLLMAAVAGHLLFARKSADSVAADCRPARCFAAGGGVGLLTGFLGVGGGFLLLPALVRFARLPVKMATGTSLAVIAVNSAAGFAGHLGHGPVRWGTGALFAALAVAGVLVGGRFAAKLPARHLQQGFALMVAATAVFVLWRAGADLLSLPSGKSSAP